MRLAAQSIASIMGAGAAIMFFLGYGNSVTLVLSLACWALLLALGPVGGAR